MNNLKDAGIWKKKHWITVCGELAFDEDVDLS